jgi:inner membrane protein
VLIVVLSIVLEFEVKSMMGKSHLIIGFASGALLAALLGVDPLHIGAAAGAAGVGAMLPDIDHRHAPIRQQLGFIGDILLFWLPHRGLTHSLLCWAFLSAVWILIAMPAFNIPVVLALALSAGYASHILADMTTQRGLPILYPFKANFYLLPRGFRVTTGSWTEFVALVLIVGSMAAVFARMRGFI